MGKVPLPILKELEHQARQNISTLNFTTTFAKTSSSCNSTLEKCQHSLKSTFKKVKSQIRKGADPEKAAKRGYEEACEYLDLWNKTLLIQHRALTCLSKSLAHILQGRISRKVLARSQAQTWDFCLKLLEHFTWAHGLSLNGFHKRSQSQLWLSHWLKCWDWLKVGLSFVNRGSNMAAIILSSLQNLKWLKIGYKYIKQPPEVVLIGCFYMFTRFSIAKWYLTRDIMCQTRNTFAISRIFWLQKMVTWHRKPLWLFDKLGLNWDPFCENHLRQRLSWAKRLRFEPVAQPETGLSLRPFMKSAPEGVTV